MESVGALRPTQRIFHCVAAAVFALCVACYASRDGELVPDQPVVVRLVPRSFGRERDRYPVFRPAAAAVHFVTQTEPACVWLVFGPYQINGSPTVNVDLIP
jgi:hypothetical protein